MRFFRKTGRLDFVVNLVKHRCKKKFISFFKEFEIWGFTTHFIGLCIAEDFN